MPLLYGVDFNTRDSKHSQSVSKSAERSSNNEDGTILLTLDVGDLEEGEVKWLGGVDSIGSLHL